MIFSWFLLPKRCGNVSGVFFGRRIFFLLGISVNIDEVMLSLRLALARVKAANRKVSHTKMLLWNSVLNVFPAVLGANTCALTSKWHGEH